jgi:hypothetical protein
VLLRIFLGLLQVLGINYCSVENQRRLSLFVPWWFVCSLKVLCLPGGGFFIAKMRIADVCVVSYNVNNLNITLVTLITLITLIYLNKQNKPDSPNKLHNPNKSNSMNNSSYNKFYGLGQLKPLILAALP